MKKHKIFNKNLHYNSVISNSLLSPWYVSGLVDGDGMFGCIISKSKNSISLEFKITALSNTSYKLLQDLKLFFNCGRIAIDNRKDGTLKYVVTDLTSIIEKIIPHFDNYPLQGSKELNFLTFKEIALLMKDKKHLTSEGFNLILAKYKTMNKNRKFSEKYEYLLNKSFNINKDWILGFIESEGTFYCFIGNVIENKIPKVYNTLEIAQATHELPLLKNIIKYLGVGYLKPKPQGDNLEDVLKLRSVSRVVCNNPDNIIIFLGHKPFKTLKQNDYILWKEFYNLVKNKAHYNKEGLFKILEIKKRMKKKSN